MFSLKPIVPDFSRSFGVILDQKDNVVETLYHTEYLRDVDVDYVGEKQKFINDMKKYCKSTDNDEFTLNTDKYKFEMACHDGVTKGFDRFIKIYYGTSGSGKTYNLAKLIRRYRQVFPKNSVIYASVNDVKNEPAFKGMEEEVKDENGKTVIDKDTGKPIKKSYIKELDLNKIETVLDVFNPLFKESLMLFDDLDANCGVFTYTDIDPGMTPEKFKALSIKEQGAITKLVDQKMDIVSKFLRLTAKSVIFNARKQHINFAYIFHSFFNNKFENELIGEASSCVVFPSKLDMSTFSRWLVAKLLFTKKEAAWFTEKRWFKWDFCEIDKTSARKFVLCNDVLKMF